LKQTLLAATAFSGGSPYAVSPLGVPGALGRSHQVSPIVSPILSTKDDRAIEITAAELGEEWLRGNTCRKR
jgi:hypothetical protein